MRFFIPISMQVLNQNINEDLIMTALYSFIRKNNNAGSLRISGGTDIAGGEGAGILLGGRDAGLPILRIVVPNAAENALQNVMTVNDSSDDPIATFYGNIDLNNHRVVDVANPTTAQDALTLHAWAAYAPDYVWTGADPSAPATVAQYVQIGNMVIAVVRVSSADSNACTDLTISLPVAPAATAGSQIACSSIEQYGAAGATYANPLAYIYQTDALIHFRDFKTATDGQAVSVAVTAIYPAVL